MSIEALQHLSKEEVFGDDGSSARGGFHFIKRGESYLFGPGSSSKTKFPRGIRSNKRKVFRIGELIAQGKSDYAIGKIIEAEYPERAPGWRLIAKMRIVIENERGPFLCQCGRGINHHEACQFKEARIKRNRALSAEAVKDIREAYGMGPTLLQLAQRWGISQSAVLAVVKGQSHKVPPLRLAQFKTKMYILQLEKLISPVDRLLEARTLVPPSCESDSKFNDKISAARDLMRQALATFQEAAQIKSTTQTQ